MVFLEMQCYSQSLKQIVPVNVLLPEIHKSVGSGAPASEYRTLWLLHGLSGNHMDWIRKSSIERYAESLNLAVVMPSVNRSWYTDTAYGIGYFTFITKELPEICRGYFKGMSDKREDNYIAGLSMGGYGAMKAALLCPDQYVAAASLSGSLDITRKNRPCILEEWRSLFDFELQNPLELEGSKYDLFADVRRAVESKTDLPNLYLWCGTEDTLITVNRDFHALLTEQNVPHVYEEGEGNHTWPWWDLHIQDALKFFFG